MEMDIQFISIYGKLVTSLTAYYSCADIIQRRIAFQNLTTRNVCINWRENCFFIFGRWLPKKWDLAFSIAVWKIRTWNILGENDWGSDWGEVTRWGSVMASRNDVCLWEPFGDFVIVKYIISAHCQPHLGVLQQQLPVPVEINFWFFATHKKY